MRSSPGCGCRLPHTGEGVDAAADGESSSCGCQPRSGVGSGARLCRLSGVRALEMGIDMSRSMLVRYRYGHPPPPHPAPPTLARSGCWWTPPWLP